ncbi:hypothetical protein Nstercoris_01152 [Nitrosomonas stercoris]|uniref:RES domain-containing protein n=1 Tax=Nitrosomonas stercoris TaxID=1444684 RepID=A0A4Y1YPF6_9PROT|nr:hypothetical protein Nstercoris_01152 [Nitrosomonas stercoris]
MFDDLSDHPEDWALAQEVETAAKLPLYRSATPVINRLFEDAKWFNAINWPFQNWQASRFSDGSYGVWYGAESTVTKLFMKQLFIGTTACCVMLGLNMKR